MEKTAYKPGENGYNRISGKKTLAFVGACIALIIILSISSFLLLFNTNSL